MRPPCSPRAPAAEDRPSLQHRVEYLGFRVVAALLRFAPARMAEAFGSGLGRVAGSVLRIRRAVVDRNLARAFAHLDPAERARLARSSYRHLGREAVAMFRVAGEAAERIRERTEVRGLSGLERALEAGRGAVIVTGHLGNWEIGGSALAARGFPLDAVAFRQRNRLFDRDLVASREALGMRVIPRGRASTEVIRSLRRGRIPALVADQNAGRNGLFVDFFGVPASTARGPAVFALRADAPLFLGVALRADGGRAAAPRYVVHLQEISFERTGDVREDVLRLTAAHTAALEAWVRRAPDQYFWVHKRWKTRPPAE